MKHLLIIFLVFYSVSGQAQRFFLYPPGQKVTLAGFRPDSLAPYVDFYKSPKSNGAAILVCPGGSYLFLADRHEGVDVAKFYNEAGFDAFVLHYRLNSPDQTGHRFPDQLMDVSRALRLVKSKGKEFNFDPHRVGIIGFSAGGHLASMGATMHIAENKSSRDVIDHWNSRPAFALLIYPVITLSGPAVHAGSRDMLLGKDASQKMIDSLSTQNRVNAQTPPTFLVYSVDDKVVPPENGIFFFQALRENNIPVSLHIYDHGGHGYGMAPKDPVLNTWPWLSLKFLEGLGYSVTTKQ